MDLEDTIAGMISDDYKERFIAEYIQTVIRARKLDELLFAAHENKLDFELNCPVTLLASQLAAMREYLHFLEMRSKYEEIDLKEVEI